MMQNATSQPAFWKTPRFILIIAWCIGICTLDWYVTGVILGVLLALPVVATSLSDDPKESRIVLLISIIGFAIVNQFGRPPITPFWVWASNRIITITALVLSFLVASKLRALRVALRAERNRAMSGSHLNRLLISLVAHDLRSPLALAGQTLDYIHGAVSRDESVDLTIVRDVRWRVQRSVDDSERLVHLAQLEMERGEAADSRLPVPLKRQLEHEIKAYETEARAAGSSITSSFDMPDSIFEVDTLVLRHLLGVLLENAIVHARPGEIRVEARVVDGTLLCTVFDAGPRSEQHASYGMGSGLKLARQIAERYGGSLQAADGTAGGGTPVLCLPVREVAELVPGYNL